MEGSPRQRAADGRLDRSVEFLPSDDVLDERATHHAPASRFRDELEDQMSDEAAETTLRAVISWARFGEAFAYDEDSGVFSLDNPS